MEFTKPEDINKIPTKALFGKVRRSNTSDTTESADWSNATSSKIRPHKNLVQSEHSMSLLRKGAQLERLPHQVDKSAMSKCIVCKGAHNAEHPLPSP